MVDIPIGLIILIVEALRASEVIRREACLPRNGRSGSRFGLIAADVLILCAVSLRAATLIVDSTEQVATFRFLYRCPHLYIYIVY